MLEEIDVVDNSFELYENMEGGNMMYVPIMEEYPSPTNTYDVFLGADGDGAQVDPNAIANAVGGVANAVASFQKTGVAKDLKTVCGRRPILKNKRERTGWNACATAFQQSMLGSPQGMGRTQTPFPTFNPTPQRQGMSDGAKVAIVFGVVAVAAVGVLIIKELRK